MIKHVNIKENNRRSKKGILQKFLTEAQKYKPLTREQEHTANRDMLIKHNMLFAASIAFRYDNSQVDIMDLISEAMIGLIKAADSYNPTYQNKFISYALFHIQSQIKEYIDTKKTFVYLPHRVQLVKYALTKYEDLDTETLAKKLNVKENVIQTAKSITGFVSLDETDEDGDNIYQVAGDERTDKYILNVEQKEIYKELTECLTQRELNVLELRYLDFYPRDLSNVANELKISRERVRQIQEQAFQKIRNKYEGIGLGS
jgi:RNA polymerase sigma factor (sigma-70 family)